MKPEFIRVALNLRKSGSSSIFCPVNRMNLTLLNPYGKIFILTPHLLREFKGPTPTLIDMDGMIDFENKCFKDFPEPEEQVVVQIIPPVIEKVTEEVIVTAPIEVKEEVTEVIVTEEVKEEVIDVPVLVTEEVITPAPVEVKETKPTHGKKTSKSK